MLIVVVGLGVIGLALAWLLVERARARDLPPGEGAGGPRTVYETAYLCGGSERVTETALCALHDKGRIALDGPLVKIIRPVADDAVERAVLDCFGPRWELRLSALRREFTRSPALRELHAQLAARGLAVPDERYAAWRRARTLLAVVSVLAGLAGLPAAFFWTPGLPVLLAAGLAGLLLSRVSPPASRLTPSGEAAADAARRDTAGAARAGSAGLVAVGGVAMLSTSAFALSYASSSREADRADGGGGGGGYVGDGGYHGGGSDGGGGGAGCGGGGGGGGGCGGGCGG